MELPNGTENLKEIGGLAGFVGLAFAWAIFYYKRMRNQPAIDPVTQKFLDGLRVDFERLEATVMKEISSIRGVHKEVVEHVERHLEGFRLELGANATKITVLDKQQAVLENELTHLKNGGKK